MTDTYVPVHIYLFVTHFKKPESMAKIKIERISEWNNKAREIGIYIDGKKVGNIDDGKTQEYNIEPGKHEIFAKTSWCYSQKVKLETDEATITSLTLTGYKYGAWVLPIILGALLTYSLGKYALNINLTILIKLGAIGFLYPMYFITFGKNRYLNLTEKNSNVLQHHSA